MKAVMELIIQKDSAIEDLNKIFTGYYPFLKIELYKIPVHENYIATKKDVLPYNLPIGLFINTASIIIIDINSHITVAELESQFASIGLTAEILRKSGNVWVETILTNNWTLQQQNAEGEEISKHFSQKKMR